MNRWTVLPLRLAVGTFHLGLSFIGMIPGARYCCFLSLDARAKRAVGRGKYARATALARELLTLADRYRNNWNYGNAIHLVLGRVALASGDVATARAELLLAGQTPGSPQLISFGPNMRLARDLFRAGETQAVLGYFEHCRRFWQLGDQQLAAWTADVQQNREPRFGANLNY